MPPPSCTGIDTARRMASTAGALTGLPANAPLRSTMCRYSKPCASKAARLRRRIVIEDGGLAHLAELEAHALAVLQVDGGEEDHAGPGADCECCDAARPSVCYLVRDQWGHVARQSRSRPAHARSVVAAPAPIRRPLTEADAVDIWIARWLQDPPQGPADPLRLRPAPAVRDLGGEALCRQPRQGADAVPASAIRAWPTASTTACTGASRAPCRRSCSLDCSTA